MKALRQERRPPNACGEAPFLSLRAADDAGDGAGSSPVGGSNAANRLSTGEAGV